MELFLEAIPTAPKVATMLLTYTAIYPILLVYFAVISSPFLFARDAASVRRDHQS